MTYGNERFARETALRSLKVRRASRHPSCRLPLLTFGCAVLAGGQKESCLKGCHFLFVLTINPQRSSKQARIVF